MYCHRHRIVSSPYFLFVVTLVTYVEGWTEAEVDEGPCLDPLPEPVQFEMKWLLAALKSDWYVTLASKAYLSFTSERLFGKPAASVEDADDLCLKFSPLTPMASITGYGGNRTVLRCMSHKVGTQDCNITDPDDPTNQTRIVKGSSSWSDNKEHILITLCLSNGKKAWTVLSTAEKVMSPPSKESVLEHVKSHGFRPEMAQDVSYEKCDTHVKLGAIKNRFPKKANGTAKG